MTQAAIDLIDRAFIGRFLGDAVDGPRSPRCRPATTGVGNQSATAVSTSAAANQTPDKWTPIADEFEAAAVAGCRVIAVVAVRRGEGCSTVAQGAARALRARGRRAVCVPRPPMQQACRDAETDAADIVIVDAGNWFPPGPIRRHHLARQAFGCDAVILVRRADRPPAAAQADAIVAIGLRLLGEVENLVGDAVHPQRESCDA